MPTCVDRHTMRLSLELRLVPSQRGQRENCTTAIAVFQRETRVGRALDSIPLTFQASSSRVSSYTQTGSVSPSHGSVRTPMVTPASGSMASPYPITSSSPSRPVVSSERLRHPIHPALASPPNSPPRVYSHSPQSTGLYSTNLETENGTRSTGENFVSTAAKRPEQNTGRRSLGMWFSVYSYDC